MPSRTLQSPVIPTHPYSSHVIRVLHCSILFNFVIIFDPNSYWGRFCPRPHLHLQHIEGRHLGPDQHCLEIPVDGGNDVVLGHGANNCIARPAISAQQEVITVRTPHREKAQGKQRGQGAHAGGAGAHHIAEVAGQLGQVYVEEG